jgi:hypothetical protein
MRLTSSSSAVSRIGSSDWYGGMTSCFPRFVELPKKLDEREPNDDNDARAGIVASNDEGRFKEPVERSKELIEPVGLFVLMTFS